MESVGAGVGGLGLRESLRCAIFGASRMTTPEFAVAVNDIDAAGRLFRFPVRAAWIRGALEGTDVGGGGESDGQLEVRLSRSGTDVVVRGTLQAGVSVPCARCLEPAHIEVSEAISALAVPATASRESPGAKEDDDLSPDQADLIAYDGETLVLDDLVRDELILGIPMIPLCSEACPGMRPQAPAMPEPNRAVDPRLRPLLRLKKT
jgi:uncharacterized protein